MEQRNVAIYARVSTDDQDASRQVAELTNWANRMGWQINGLYVETVSGAARTRPSRQELISIAKKPRVAKTSDGIITFGAPISTIIVTELSRWSRSTVDLVTTLDDLASHGVSVLTLQGLSLDMSTPTGKLTATILASVAEFERDLIRERTRSGMAHAKSQGKRLGRPPGARSGAWKHYKQIILARQSGKSLQAISACYGISRSTVKRMIDHHKANIATSPSSPTSADTSASQSYKP